MNKKYTFFIIALLAISFNITADSENTGPETINPEVTNTEENTETPGITDKAKALLSKILCYPFAHKDASEETLKYANELAQKVDPNIKINSVKQLNRFGQLLFGYQNSMSLPFLNTIILNEKYIKDHLVEEEKRFTIGRQICSLSNAPEYCTYKYLIPIALELAIKKIYKNGTTEDEDDDSETINKPGTFKTFLIGILANLATLKAQRNFEYNADAQTGQKLDCINGGISVLEKSKEFKDDGTFLGKYFSTIALTPLLPIQVYIKEILPNKLTKSSNRLENFFSNLPLFHYFNTIPRTNDRIKALEEIAQS